MVKEFVFPTPANDRVHALLKKGNFTGLGGSILRNAQFDLNRERIAKKRALKAFLLEEFKEIKAELPKAKTADLVARACYLQELIHYEVHPDTLRFIEDMHELRTTLRELAQTKLSLPL